MFKTVTKPNGDVFDNDMTQAAYESVPSDTPFQTGQTDTSQFYNSQNESTKDTGQSLVDYTPDSSTNIVHWGWC